MFTRICFFLVVSISLAWCAGTYLAAAPNDGAPNDEPPTDVANQETKITELLTQRRDVLRELLNAVETMRRAGATSADRVVAARDALLLVEIDLAASKSERIELCKKRIENLRGLERIFAEKHAQGSATIESTLLAKATRIQAEIDCLREESAAE